MGMLEVGAAAISAACALYLVIDTLRRDKKPPRAGEKISRPRPPRKVRK